METWQVVCLRLAAIRLHGEFANTNFPRSDYRE